MGTRSACQCKVFMQVGSLMGELLFGYMVHNGYWETAAAIGRDMLDGTVQVQPKDIQEVKLRNSIAEDVVAGNIAEAIHLADTLAPGMLAANPSLQFRLHLQTFYDLVGALRVMSLQRLLCMVETVLQSI